MEAAEEDAAEGGNERGASMKGTVRPLADSISVEEAERASKQVREAIAQKQHQLEELQRFSDENKSLSELVLELPDSVSHRIMVPFGKAAFFPGRLIHTNEFLVLLGESHYAERSAKQTVEILERRSEFLGQKIASAKAQIADLEAESSFVTNTAKEAKAGLVEIREEYTESVQPQLKQASTSRITEAAASSQTDSLSQVGSGSSFGASTARNGNESADEDLEHDLLMARLSELEMAEASAGVGNEGSDEEVHEDSNDGIFEPFRSSLRRSEVSRNEDLVEEEYDGKEMEEEDSQLGNSDDEDDYVEDAEGSSEEEVDAQDDGEDDNRIWKHEHKQEEVPIVGRPLSRFAREALAKKEALDSQYNQDEVKILLGSPTGRKPQSVVNHEIHTRTLKKPEAMQEFNGLQKGLEESRREVYQKDASLTLTGHALAESQANEIKGGGSSASGRAKVPSLGEPAAAQLKAFSGIVMEHSSTEPATANKQQVEESQESRPVSRFKMSRR